MIARALLVLPLSLVFSIGPGFFFVRRFRWGPLEKLTGSIALSLILLFALTFAAYLVGLSRPAYYVIGIALGTLTVASIRDAVAFARQRAARQTVLAFALLLAWTLALQSLIRHYSGGDWCCDWLEHYQRSVFFVERWSTDFLF